MRRCTDCGESIEDRGNRAVRCEVCQRAKALADRRRKAGKREKRVCPTCGEDMSHLHGNAKHCEGCAYDRKLAAGRRERRNLDSHPMGPGNRAGRFRYRSRFVTLLVEQRGLCGICGWVLDGNEPTKWQVDEIVPRSMGGGDEPGNQQVTHAQCQERKGDAWEGSQVAQWRKWARWKLTAQ